MDVKQNTLIEYARRFGSKVFVETATDEDGNTVRAMHKSKLFEQMHTISASIDRAHRAHRRTSHLSHVHCWTGDPATRLEPITRGIRRPILFWLNTAAEVEAALRHPNADEHVLLIGGARRLKKGRLKELVLSVFPEWVFEVKENVIRCHAKDEHEA